MKKYIGTKEINAKPMNRLEYNQFRGWELPSDENGADEGYLVEYVDGGKANTSEYKGYISWSPKDVFERAYKVSDTPLDRMKIEIEELKSKSEKLELFLNRSNAKDIVGEDQYNLMCSQHEVMNGYIHILQQRIDLF